VGENNQSTIVYRKLAELYKVDYDRIKLLDNNKNEIKLSDSVKVKELYKISPKLTISLRPELLSDKIRPKYLLANTPLCLNRLLSLLSIKETYNEIIEKTWNLIIKLPYNEDLYSKMLEFPIESTDYNQFENLLYKLYLLSEAIIQNSNDFKSKFIAQDTNFKEVINIFDLVIPKISRDSYKLDLKCLLYELKILALLLDQQNVSELYQSATKRLNLWESLSHFLNLFLTPAIEKMNEEQSEIVGFCMCIQSILIVGNPSEFSDEIISGKYLNLLGAGIFRTKSINIQDYFVQEMRN